MSAGAAEGAAAAPAGRAAIARRLRARLGPPPERDDWPPVSIVVVNRDGEQHLRLLLPRLAHATDYPQIEVILVDNASQDGSVEFARSSRLPFPLTVVENDANLSFSDANDDAVERARHEHLLFLNNDVEPFEPGWLKELVACLERHGAAAAGATLLHGAKHGASRGSGYVLQHRRVEFASEGGFVVPVNAGDGDDLESLGWTDDDDRAVRPTGEGMGVDSRAAASTAACLLIRREAFDRIGGFTTGFLWGWEDVDLGLKLASGGDEVVCSGRSVLFHHESSTRSRPGHEWSRRMRAANQQLFMERWGPQARREYLLDRISRTSLWTDGRPPRLAITLSGVPERDRASLALGDAVEDEGWRVALVEPGDDGWAVPRNADFALVTDPSAGASMPAGLACVAWACEPAEAWTAAPWMRRAELVLAGHPGVIDDLAAAGVAAVPFAGAVDSGRVGRRSANGPREIDCLIVDDRDQLTPECALAFEEGGAARVLAVGAGWERWGRFEALGAVPDEGLSVLYASARLVICDSTAGAREAGGPADASRLLEAALAGALPLTDDAELIDELFGDAELPTWSSPEDLRELVDDLLADEPRRRALAERCAAIARDWDDWPARARQLVTLLVERSRRLRFCLKLSRVWELEPAARSLRHSLDARGHACSLQLPDEWGLLAGLTADVAVAIGDPDAYRPTPAQLNALWTPEALRPTECDQWDLVLIPDADVAASLGAETPTPIAALDLRADTDAAGYLLDRIAWATAAVFHDASSPGRVKPSATLPEVHP